MNLVENWIVEVISVKDISDEWCKSGFMELPMGEPMYEVELLTNCHGCKSKQTEIWRKSEYEEIIKKGYYLR